MDEGLQFTEDAELNRYLFYSDINEINFFVEDKDKEYEYETIFSKMFEGKYRIASIIAAGGKKGVKKAYEEFGEVDSENPTKNNIYIVDGDFDRYIHQQEMICNRHFIYLKYYNIENYFIDEKAILKFAKGKLHMLDSEVKDIVRYVEWRDKIVTQAGRLFLLYCAVQKSLPAEPNVARNEYLFIDDKTGFERAGAYSQYYQHILSLDSDIIIEMQKIMNTYESINGPDYFGLICGKFLLTSLFVYLRGRIKKSFTRDELRWSLLCDFDMTSLDYIKEAVNYVCTT